MGRTFLLLAALMITGCESDDEPIVRHHPIIENAEVRIIDRTLRTNSSHLGKYIFYAAHAESVGVSDTAVSFVDMETGHQELLIGIARVTYFNRSEEAHNE